MGASSGELVGGADGIRTHDLLDAIEARSQLRHGPTEVYICTYSTTRYRASDRAETGNAGIIQECELRAEKRNGTERLTS